MPWSTLSLDQKRFQSTKKAIHAAMVDRMDREIGRVLEQLRAMGAWENTLIIFLSDNGADAWASAANAPFRRHKIWVHEGGISTPCILQWPARIRSGGKLRHTPAHGIDFVPTVLDLAEVEAPLEWRVGGVQRCPARALSRCSKATQRLRVKDLYWHHEGNRALRVDDRKLVSESENGDKWELYDLKRDRIESLNLAESNPGTVKQMSAQWERMDQEFRRQSVMDK